MDGLDAGEDPYSDDDLDGLPSNAFSALEQAAFTSTQQAKSNSGVWDSSVRGPLASAAPTIIGRGQHLVKRDALQIQMPLGNVEASSDYGDMDDDMLDGEIFDAADSTNVVPVGNMNAGAGESTQREAWRQQRYGKPVGNGGPSIIQNVIQPSIVNGTIHMPNAKEYSAPAIQALDFNSQTVHDGVSLQERIDQLLWERSQLQQAVQQANDNAYAKAGEIAIVRANASKIEKEYEKKTQIMQTLHADESAKQRSEVEKAKAELKKIATEKDFLENDLTEGTKQIRNLQKAVKKGISDPIGPGRTALADLSHTPPKVKHALGDGFDVQPLSPSRLALRGRAGTPKAGSKRKRRVPEDSPAHSGLELQQLEEALLPDNSPFIISNDQLSVAQDSKKPDIGDGPFIRTFLNHRPGLNEERTIEILGQYRFPSNPKRTLSSILFDKISPTSISFDTEYLPSAVALQVISVWSQCIREKYYDPVHLLMDLVQSILIVDPVRTPPDLVNDLMSLLQETADIIVIPRCQKKPAVINRGGISSNNCLSMIYLMAHASSSSLEESNRLWRTMRFDFVMMLLSFIHPPEELALTIQILHTSILDSSFAMIIPPGDGKQDTSEARVIDNLSRLLVESPRPTQGESPLKLIELANLRLSILELIQDMCANDYAAVALCRHRLLLGRLVRLMNDSLSNAYNYNVAHRHLIVLVNHATRLLYYLTSNFSSQINMQQKLSVIPGGEKKYLIVLTRLAFSNGGVLEDGISDDVVDLAHRMLEERVSPEEAEGLVEAMSSAPGSRAHMTRDVSMINNVGPEEEEEEDARAEMQGLDMNV